MRRFIATSIGVACTAALALPLTGSSPAVAAPSPEDPSVPGSTRSLPLDPPSDRILGAVGERSLIRREIEPFSLVGVVWDDASAELHGTVQVRTRATGTGTWSDWQDLQTHNGEHAADPDTAEGRSGRARGSTAPLWVGDSDGIEVRVRAQRAGGDSRRSATPSPALPAGLRVELVDPGDGPSRPEAEAESGSEFGSESRSQARARGPRTAALAALPEEPLELPELDEEETLADAIAVTGGQVLGAAAQNAAEDAEDAAEVTAESAVETVAAIGAGTLAGDAVGAVTAVAGALTGGSPGGVVQAGATLTGAAAGPYIGPRPRIVTRKGWGADESLREGSFVYTSKIKAAFVHHSATGNNYTCAQAPSVLRGIYRYHVVSMGWRDFGYNFAVDKCGNIYEGRAGGVAEPVLGAHTLGFNANSMGIAVLGTYSDSTPSTSAVTAVARLTAWKLGLHGANPKGTTTLTSGGNKYPKGTKVRLNVISGHRDGFATECPGSRLYSKLGTTRTESAGLQGR
ncbi:peptidoglycan recognition protein [Streptomyces sp. GC420]|uniref:peptidoglycan recognition protein family protein n=1 Tax=Streptomyces sp. GC420 TaxID=2697568 RepID=UPI001414E244|nr:peptidoglycan recognition protein [Streptomyces sp. GC420]NBM18206.1 N-acetylmuramoyl-L-alanine amidase [Streptomyces sp. GC420]